MSRIPQCPPCATWSTSRHHVPLSFRHVGNGHPWTISHNQGIGQISPCRSELLHFTKWVKVEPLATITTQKVQKYTWKCIICRYDIPQAIVTNNRRQFIEKGLWRVPLVAWHQAPHLFGWVSLDQWASRSRKQGHPCRVTQKSVESPKGTVGGQALERGLRYHCTPSLPR